jgi:bifunctional DNase/RNase
MPTFFNVDTRIKLRVQGLTNSQVQSGAYALVLAEENGLRRVPIIVGTAEAQSIAIALEHIIPPRPLTHDLMVTLIRMVHIEPVEVFIYKFEDGVFYSEINIRVNGETLQIDSRTSDAIAIALRMNCNIYTTEAIMKECGVVLEDDLDTDDEQDMEVDDIENDAETTVRLEPDDMKSESQLLEWLSVMPQKELQERLQEAIASENYEFAKIYQDEQDRRDREDHQP